MISVDPVDQAPAILRTSAAPVDPDKTAVAFDPAITPGPVTSAAPVALAIILAPVKAAAASSGVPAMEIIVPIAFPTGISGRIGATIIGPTSTMIGTTIGDDYNQWFDGDWCHHHPYWHCDPGFNYWGWATWGAVTNWFPWGWNQPVYYNYGDNVYYQDDQVYYGDQPVASAEDYAYQAEQIATSVPQTPPPADSWMPLGVFAITPNDDAGADPTIFLQLTVSKEGVLAGTFQNTTSGTIKSIEGMVDKQSQRAAWTEVGKTRPIMETGISNLTEDTAPVLVHYADGTTQQWLLVRLDKPPETAGADGIRRSAAVAVGSRGRRCDTERPAKSAIRAANAVGQFWSFGARMRNAIDWSIIHCFCHSSAARFS